MIYFDGNLQLYVVPLRWVSIGYVQLSFKT